MAIATSDIKLSFTGDPTHGTIIVDFVKTSQGDFATVAGADRLIQDINRIFFMMIGANPFRPSEGNALFNQVGRAQRSDMPTVIVGIIEQMEAYIVTQQQQAASLGYRGLDDMLASFQQIKVSEAAPSGSGVFTASFTVVSRAGVATAYTTPSFNV